MRGLRLTRLVVAASAATLALAVGGAGPVQASWSSSTHASTSSYPSSMSALGDSITRAYNASGWFRDWPARSWSTGSDPTVQSHYTRLVKLNSRIKGNVYNYARTGAKMGALHDQASLSSARGAEYVTVLVGANDACTDTVEGMTPTATFRTQFEAAMNQLAGQSPRPKVLVASIPNLHRLWEIGKGNASARSAWDAYDICQSLLARPLSEDQQDKDRRSAVLERVREYNSILSDVCLANYFFCKYDGGAVFDYQFALRHLSTWDYFHPNVAGQTRLAEVTWTAGYWSSS